MEQLPAEMLTTIVSNLVDEKDFLNFWHTAETNRSLRPQLNLILTEWLKRQKYSYLQLIELASLSQIPSFKTSAQEILQARINNGLVKKVNQREGMVKYITPKGEILYNEAKSWFVLSNGGLKLTHKFSGGKLVKEIITVNNEQLRIVSYNPDMTITEGYNPKVWSWLQTHDPLLDQQWENFTDKTEETPAGDTIFKCEVRVLNPQHLILEEVRKFHHLTPSPPPTGITAVEEYMEDDVSYVMYLENGLLVDERSEDANGLRTRYYFAEENRPLVKQYPGLQDWLHDTELDDGLLHIRSSSHFHNAPVPYTTRTTHYTYDVEVSRS